MREITGNERAIYQQMLQLVIALRSNPDVSAQIRQACTLAGVTKAEDVDKIYVEVAASQLRMLHDMLPKISESL